MPSKELSKLIEQINAKGMQKLDGYSVDMLEGISPEERNEAERIIVDAFNNGDGPIAVLVGKLTLYDGKKILEDALNNANIPSGRSIEIVFALAEDSLSELYKDILERNYKEDTSSRLLISEKLMTLQPSLDLFDFYEKLFHYASSSPERTSLANGILYSCGIIKNPNDMDEVLSSIKLNSAISVDNTDVSLKEIRKLREQFFPKYCTHSLVNIYISIQREILRGEKMPHSTSQPVIYYDNGKYYLAVFVFFYSKNDIENGAVDRPTIWAIADLKTGEIIKEYETKEKDFSDAPYDMKYSIRSNAKYDTSKEYYDKTLAILDSVREKLISTGRLHKAEYQTYLDRILANIPEDYKRFYRDLSV